MYKLCKVRAAKFGDGGYTLTIAIGCLLLCCLAPPSAGATSGTDEDENRGTPGLLSIGGRQLLQVSNQCPHQFSLDNFTALEVACPNATIENAATYPKQACCQALADMLCPYQTYINDPNSLCAASYWSTLLHATGGNLTQEFFQITCTDVSSERGIPCPSNVTAPAPNQSWPKQDLHSFGLTLLLGAAVLEFLRMCG